MNTTTIVIMDRGRGPQLSSSRITVQDVYPYLKQQCSSEQIQQIMPSLTLDELAVIKDYVRNHSEEVQAADRFIEERNAARLPSPDETEAEREARRQRLVLMRQKLEQASQEKACDPVAC